MKAYKIIVHRFTVIASFFFIMISGQQFGGFYVLYLLLALPYGGIHALLALFAVAMLLVSHKIREREKGFFVGRFLNILGVVMLNLSLFLFFYNDKQHYNYDTFSQLVPLVTLIIFFILSVIFFLDNVYSVIKRTGINNRIGNVTSSH